MRPGERIPEHVKANALDQPRSGMELRVSNSIEAVVSMEMFSPDNGFDSCLEEALIDHKPAVVWMAKFFRAAVEASIF